MKPSGIAWIGDIPESWDVKPIAYMSDSRSGGTPDRNDLRYWENGTISWMSSGEVNKVNVYETEEKITELAIHNSSAKMIKANSVMIALNGQGKTKGMSAVLRIDSACNQSLCAFTCYDRVLHYEYLFWCFQTMYIYLRQMSGDDVRDGLAASYVKKQKISVPSYQEQTFIANFLDNQCEKINGIIADIEQQIELLEKYKKSLITETVTKGLDKNAPMKDSGIEWIGDINTDYKLTKLKYIVSTPITDGPHETPILLDDGVPFLSAEAVRNERLEFDNKRGYISESDHRLFCKKCKPQRNDIFMIKSGATTGKIAIVDTDDEFSIWSPLALVRCDDVMIKQKFIFYSMLSNYFFKNIELAWSYGTQQNIGMGVIGNLRIVLPIVTEQTQIADFLDKKCTQVDAIIETKKQQLELMKKHKQSMIYEYVTGKKRVTEVQN